MPIPRSVRDATRRAIEAREAHLVRVAGRVGDHLGRLRQAVTGALSGLDLTALGRRVSRLIAELGRQTREFERAATREVRGEGETAVALGQDVVDRPLESVSIQIAAPDVTLPVLETLTDFAADRITGLSGDMINQISAELRLGALGVKPVHDVILAISAKLKKAGADGRGAGSLANRAESIVRTELGRIHSMSTQRRMEQALLTTPDLQKEWRHSGNLLNPRDGHQAISGTRVPVREAFLVAPTRGGNRERMMHPRDPAASARNVVRCRCDVIPWLQRWED